LNNSEKLRDFKIIDFKFFVVDLLIYILFSILIAYTISAVVKKTNIIKYIMKYNHLYRIIFSVLLITTFISCNNIAAGSYPFAERYDIYASEKLLITAVVNFKKHHPEFNVPNTITLKGNPTNLKDGHNGKDDYWCHIYFYYPDNDQIINSWIRSADNEKTTFALVSINQGLEIGNWKKINNDLNGIENEFQKKKFEKIIINGIKKELSNLKK